MAEPGLPPGVSLCTPPPTRIPDLGHRQAQPCEPSNGTGTGRRPCPPGTPTQALLPGSGPLDRYTGAAPIESWGGAVKFCSGHALQSRFAHPLLSAEGPSFPGLWSPALAQASAPALQDAHLQPAALSVLGRALSGAGEGLPAWSPIRPPPPLPAPLPLPHSQGLGWEAVRFPLPVPFLYSPKVLVTEPRKVSRAM